MSNDQDWEVRRLRNGDRIGTKGYALEVVEGGQRAHAGRIYYVQEGAGSSGGFDEQSYTVPLSGARQIGDFAGLYYTDTVLPDSGGSTYNEITVRILKVNRAVWSDGDPQGKARSCFLARSVATTAIGQGITLGGAPATTVIWDDFTYYAPQASGERYWTDERLDSRQFMYGWIHGEADFDVWILAKTDMDNLFAAWRPVNQFNAQDLTTLPAHLITGDVLAGFAFDFCSSLSVKMRIPWPAGYTRIIVENKAVGTNNIEYMIGHVGHT